MDEILIYENEKVSAAKEAHENDESEFDENTLDQIDNMNHENTKENVNDVSGRLNEKLKIKRD